MRVAFTIIRSPRIVGDLVLPLVLFDGQVAVEQLHHCQAELGRLVAVHRRVVDAVPDHPHPQAGIEAQRRGDDELVAGHVAALHDRLGERGGQGLGVLAFGSSGRRLRLARGRARALAAGAAGRGVTAAAELREGLRQGRGIEVLAAGDAVGGRLARLVVAHDVGVEVAVVEIVGEVVLARLGVGALAVAPDLSVVGLQPALLGLDVGPVVAGVGAFAAVVDERAQLVADLAGGDVGGVLDQGQRGRHAKRVGALGVAGDVAHQHHRHEVGQVGELLGDLTPRDRDGRAIVLPGPLGARREDLVGAVAKRDVEVLDEPGEAAVDRDLERVLGLGVVDVPRLVVVLHRGPGRMQAHRHRVLRDRVGDREGLADPEALADRVLVEDLAEQLLGVLLRVGRLDQARAMLEEPAAKRADDVGVQGLIGLADLAEQGAEALAEVAMDADRGDDAPELRDRRCALVGLRDRRGHVDELVEVRVSAEEGGADRR
jgi:hypothetical protein